jgi:predicted Fe-Mo cluster-binding NifX family protein
MKLCIPIRAPNGLESCIEPYLPCAEHLLFFDTRTREFWHVALREHLDAAADSPRFDVVLCESFDEATRKALAERGITAFGTNAPTVGEAIDEFRAHCAGAEQESGKALDSPGGRRHEAHADISRKMLADALRIAVSTGHAGRCRRFWVYEIRKNRVDAKTLRELTFNQTLYSSLPDREHPLGDVHVMIAAAVSPFLYQRLQRCGIRPFITDENDPDKAVLLLLEKIAQV